MSSKADALYSQLGITSRPRPSERHCEAAERTNRAVYAHVAFFDKPPRRKLPAHDPSSPHGQPFESAGAIGPSRKATPGCGLWAFDSCLR